MSLNLKQLEAFVSAADLGSFSKAAVRLNTTQPNISLRIASLETVLETILMERDAGSVRLTARGRDLLIYARRVLQATEDLKFASENAASIEGTLRLGVTEMIVHTWLSDFLERLTETFPSIAVELTVDVSVTLDKDLADRSLDLAFQSGPFRYPVTGSEALGTYSLTWFAAPSVAAQFEGPATLEDMLAFPILTHAKNTQPYAELDAHLRQVTGVVPRLVPSNNLSACLHMTAKGMGIATLLQAMVADELAAGRLVEIDYAWRPAPLSFFARYDADRAPKYVATAAQLAREVAEEFATQG